MGIGSLDLQHLALLDRAIGVGKIASVCDLGEQEFGPADPVLYPVDRFAELLGVNRDVVLASKMSEQIWTLAGRKHLSLDVVGTNFRYFDLNVNNVPDELRGAFDLVTNFGTTEHVANQLNAFRAIHDLVRPGGVMYHSLPVAGYSHHGLINYNVNFFMMLARDNGYEVIDALLTVMPSQYHLNKDVEDFFLNSPSFQRYRDGPYGLSFDWRQHVRDFHSADAGVRICLRKLKGDDFYVPMDLLGVEVPKEIKRKTKRRWFLPG